MKAIRRRTLGLVTLATMVVVAGLLFVRLSPTPVAPVAVEPNAGKTQVRAPPLVQSASPVPATAPTSVARLWASLDGRTGQELDPKSASHPQAQGKDVKLPGRSATFPVGSLTSLAALRRGDHVVLPLFAAEQVTGKVNLVQQQANGWVRVGGEITGPRTGSFSLGSNGGKVSGTILLPLEERAYAIMERPDGQVFMEEKHISEVICFPMPRFEDEPAAAVASLAPPEAPPVLSSRPGAIAVLYLDFDGETVTDPHWNSGDTIEAQSSSLSSAGIAEVWNRVKEDFWPFDIDVTTVRSRYDNAPVGRRMRCIITPTCEWYKKPCVGGVAYLNCFAQAGNGFSDTIPCWVFNGGVIGVAEAVSHEFGHAFGLRHDGRTSPSEEYYRGHGSGAVGWAPIMGVGYDRDLVQWSKGEYLSANNQENDIAIIANATHGFGFFADQAGDTRASAAALTASGSSVNQSGIISGDSDVDFYVFAVAAGTVASLTANPASISPNLDIYLEVQDSAGSVLASSNPDTALNAAVTFNVPAGTYYVKIQGIGRGDVLGDGYSSYGSIGHYSVTGSIETSSGFVYLFFEAESGTEFSPLSVGGDAQASGGQYISTSSFNQGRASYALNIASAGDYRMWWRALALDPGVNSFYLNLYTTTVNTDWTHACDIPPRPGWQWGRVNRRPSAGQEGTNSADARVLTLVAGPLDFVIGGREIGTRLDRILITNDPDFVPSDAPNPPEIRVMAGANNIADGQGAAIDFGSVAQGQPGPSVTFTLSNDGGQTLTLGAPSVPAGYTVTEALASSLAPAASDTFTVRLDSLTQGTQSGQVSFSNNDSDENPFNFPITGQVTAPPQPAEVTVLVDGNNVSDGQGTAIDFGSVAQGQTGPTKTFTVRNDGGQTLTLGAPSVPTGYTLTEPLAGSLGPGGQDTFTVRLDTATQGTQSGQVSFSNNDSDESPFSFSVTGGVTNSLAFVYLFFEAESGTEFSPLSVGSDAQASGGQYIATSTFDQGRAAYSVNIPNAGNYYMWWRALTPNAGSNSFYLNLYTTVVNTHWTNVSDMAPLTGWRWGQVHRRPSQGQEGTNSADVRVLTLVAGPLDFVIGGRERGTLLDRIIITNDPDFVPSDAPNPPEIRVMAGANNIADGQGAAIDFGSVVQGQPGPSVTFTVFNDGSQTLTLGAPSVPASYTLTEALAASLASGAQDTFTVRLDSLTQGTKSGQISFTNNDSDENPFNFPITGQVTAPPSPPEITVLVDGNNVSDGQGTAIDFGSVAQGQPGPTKTFTVRNDGGQTLTLGAPSVPAGYTVTEPLTASLAPSGQDTFTVRLDTATQGTKSGQVSFTNNDSDENPFNSPVTGAVTNSLGFVYLFLEAESGTEFSPLSVGSDAQASGGQYISTSAFNQGQASYALNIASAGDYRMWWRALALDPGVNSFYLNLYTTTVNTDWTHACDIPPRPGWQWGRVNRRPSAGQEGTNSADARVLTLVAGPLDFVIGGREIGTRLDRILVTNDPNFVPTDPPLTPGLAGEAGNAAQGPRVRSIRYLRSGRIRLEIEAPSDRPMRVLGSTDLNNWSELGRVQADANGRWVFTDADAHRYPLRFYRVLPPVGTDR